MTNSRPVASNGSKRWGRHWVVVALLATTAASGDDGSFWDKFGPSGSVRLGAFERDRSFSSERGVLTGSAWLTLRPEEILGTKFFFEGYGYGENFSRQSRFAGDVREAYAERSFGSVDVRVGRQLQIWGRSDKLNPTDSLTVRDQTLLLTDDEDARLGLFATQATWNLGDFRWSFVWQPEFRKPVFPLGNLPASVRLSHEQPSGTAAQFATKLDHSGGDVDWSLSYFTGFDKTPDFALRGADATGVDLALVHRRVHVVGGDLAFNALGTGFRGEASYTFTEDTAGNDPLTKNRFLYLVFGADRNFWSDFNLNVQGLARWTTDFVPLSAIADANQRAIAAEAYPIWNQTQEWLFGASARLSHKAFHETLESEIAVVVYFGRGDFLLRPKVTYAVTDNFKAIVGAELFRGSRDSFFGRIQQVSTGFVEVRWLY